MRTARLLTVSVAGGGGVGWGGDVFQRGYAFLAATFYGGLLQEGGLPYAGRRVVCLPHGIVGEQLTHTYENITFPQLRLRKVINEKHK